MRFTEEALAEGVATRRIGHAIGFAMQYKIKAWRLALEGTALLGTWAGAFGAGAAIADDQEEHSMYRLLRALLRIEVRISRSEALERARRHCEKDGLPWDEPVSLSLGLRTYEFMTASDGLGGNVFGEVDCETGDVRAQPPTLR